MLVSIWLRVKENPGLTLLDGVWLLVSIGFTRGDERRTVAILRIQECVTLRLNEAGFKSC